MKKSLMASLFVFCCLLLIVQTATAAMNVRIVVDRLNVRTGPGLTFPMQGKVAKGKQYAVVQKRGEWLQIRLASNRTGWVYGKYVQMQNEQMEKKKQIQQLTAVDYPKLGILLPYIRAYSNKTAAISDFHSRGSCPEKKRRTNERKVRDEVVRFSVR